MKNFASDHEPENSTETQDRVKVCLTFCLIFCLELEEFTLTNVLRLTVQPKTINYTDFPAQFELLYTNTFDFEMATENHKFIFCFLFPFPN